MHVHRAQTMERVRIERLWVEHQCHWAFRATSLFNAITLGEVRLNHPLLIFAKWKGFLGHFQNHHWALASYIEVIHTRSTIMNKCPWTSKISRQKPDRIV